MKHLINLNAMAFIAAMCSLSLVACDDDDDAPNNDLNMYKGHEYVDLGLSVKWATCNVGAENPEDYGSYYAWGETETKSDYSWDTYTDGEFIGDGKTTLDAADDAATANWGGDWTMPTASDFDELKDKCTWTWTTENEVNGYRVIGTNGNSIFLPAAGGRKGSGLDGEGSYGYYWSSSLDESNSGSGRFLYFNSGYVNAWGSSRRYVGFPVRPVCPSAE